MKWIEIKNRIQKLTNDANSEFYKYTFNEALSILVRERFIARVALSTFKDSIILKGGLLLTMVYTKSARYTGDADIGLPHAYALKDYQQAIDSVLAVDLKDGFSFKRNKGEILSNEIRKYDGAQFTIICDFAAKQQNRFNLDIGVGDIVTPTKAKLPTLKDFEASSVELLVYPPETIAAEKLHAIINHGIKNSRFKDFYDLYVLRDYVDKKKFMAAVKLTFAQRKMPYPGKLPEMPEEITELQPKWTSFLKSKRYRILKTVPKDLREIMEAIREFYGTEKP